MCKGNVALSNWTLIIGVCSIWEGGCPQPPRMRRVRTRIPKRRTEKTPVLRPLSGGETSPRGGSDYFPMPTLVRADAADEVGVFQLTDVPSHAIN